MGGGRSAVGILVLYRKNEDSAAMASVPNTSNSDGTHGEPVPKAETAGPGGGRKAKTRVGAGDGGGGGSSDWYGGDLLERDPNRKVLYSHLKDMAIDALEISGVKDQQAIARSIGSVLGSFDMQPEIADVLASMVVAAYSCAKDTCDERAVFLAYSCFTDAQLARIVKLARAK
jgi:hypothetical protein